MMEEREKEEDEEKKAKIDEDAPGNQSTDTSYIGSYTVYWSVQFEHVTRRLCFCSSLLVSQEHRKTMRKRLATLIHIHSSCMNMLFILQQPSSPTIRPTWVQKSKKWQKVSAAVSTVGRLKQHVSPVITRGPTKLLSCVISF